MVFKILGHRGNGRTTETPFAAGKAPQQTLLSFEQAVKNGADGVEFDVFLSKDMVPVIVDKDKNQGYIISEMFRDDIKRICLPQNQQIPTLEDALILLADLGHRRKKGGLIINIELKGQSVVEHTLKVIDRVVLHHPLKKSQIFFSSFDRDKLSLVREIDADANLQPTIATMQLFDPAMVAQPGYHVEPHVSYNKKALKELKKFIREKKCVSIDTPTGDIRLPLIELAADLGVGFCTHPTGPRRRESAPHLYETLGLLDAFSRASGHVFFKVDDLRLARRLLEDRRVNAPLPVDKIERVMGMNLL